MMTVMMRTTTRKRMNTSTSQTVPQLTAWTFERLPLVLLTVGDELDEFETLYDHLEMISEEMSPQQQTLIIARPEVPDMLYRVLQARTVDLPHVHIRRLNDDTANCEVLRHETGTFYVTQKRIRKALRQ